MPEQQVEVSKLQCQFKKVNVEPKEVKVLCSTTQGMSMTLLMLLQSRDHSGTDRDRLR